MKKSILILLFCISSASAFDFQYEPLGIPVQMSGGDIPVSPWIGGVFHAAPVLIDIDADGDYDMFVGNGPGYLQYYENTGTPENAEWTFVTEAYDSIWAGIGYNISNFICAKPNFADIDNDNDLDLFIGWDGGRILYYSNQGNSTSPAWHYETNYFDSIGVYWDASPTLHDIDSDGDLDLFIGDFQSHFYYYENIGTLVMYEFQYVTDQFLGYIYESRMTPAFVDIDSDGDLDCFVGGYFGTIHYFRNDGDSVNYDFTYVTDNYMGIDVGDYSVPYFCDIDNDGDYDLFVGEGGYPESYTPYLGLGDVNFYENVGDVYQADFVLRNQNMLTLDIEFNSYPTFSDIDNDGDYDLFLGESQGNLNFFRNIGTTVSPSFVLETEFFNEEFFGWQCTPSFIDLDADGDQDLIIGCGVGFGQTEVRVYRNDGPLPNPNFTLIDDNLLPFTVNDANQYLVDIDNDNDYDMFVGDGNGNLGFYRNLGDSARYNFVLEIINVIGTWEYDPFPVLLDIDHDDDYDLFAGGCGRLVFFLNIGTPEVFNFVLEADTFCNIYNSPGNCYPAFCDIDGDDDSDLFFGEVDGGLQFYRNQANPSSVVLTVSISPPDVILNWNPIAGASEYNIYTDDTPYFLPTGLPAFTVLPPDTFYIHSGVMNSNTKLFYRMKVVNE